MPHGTYKRFVNTLDGVSIDGVKAFVNHKKQSALQKGMKQLLVGWKVTEGKIMALSTEMVSVAQTTLKEVEEYIERDIVKTYKRLELLT